MSKLGRNDPCPCGSGKKYKKCCQVSAEAIDFEYRRHRRVEADLMPRLLDYAYETYGPEFFQDAWNIFNDGGEGDEDVPLPEPDDPINELFMSWYLFNWEFEDMKNPERPECTIAETFRVEHGSELVDEEIEYLGTAVLSPFSLFEVLEFHSGVGMELCDLFTTEKVYISDLSTALDLERGMIIYASLLKIGRIISARAIGPLALGSNAKSPVVELRDEMIREMEVERLNDTHVLACDMEIRSLYLGLLIDQ